MDYVSLVNLIFSLIIIFLGVKKFNDTGAKAFIFIALGFFMYGVSHFSAVMAFNVAKEVLIAIRSAGYILIIIGLLL